MIGEEGLELPQVLAAIAAKEWESLEVIKADVCQWLAKPAVLQLAIAPASFLDVLDSGVEVCRLANLVQQAAKESGDALSFQVPMEALTCHTKASACNTKTSACSTKASACNTKASTCNTKAGQHLQHQGQQFLCSRQCLKLHQLVSGSRRGGGCGV